jgi:uncharacterized protein (DUF488 family)
MSRPLYTIGYEGAQPADFFDRLLTNSVRVLIDVRDLPLSRKRGFSKNALREGLAERGIEYLHLKGLGDPKPGRIAAREGRYSDFRRIFNAHMQTSAAQQALAEAVHLASSSVACLLCFEQDHRNCHRCIVADEIVRVGAFSLTHLRVSRSKREISRGYKSTRNDRTLSLIG